MGIKCINRQKASINHIFWGLFTSPDYRFKDFRAIMMNGYQNNIALWKEILKLDLSNILINISIPYAMIQVDTDIVASTYRVKKVVEYANNVNLRYQIISHTGHISIKTS